MTFANSQNAVLIQNVPYRWVRHPFYAAYLLFRIAGAAAAAEPRLTVSVVVMGAVYVKAIQREERKLLARTDLPGYAAYRAGAGCLMPRPW